MPMPTGPHRPSEGSQLDVGEAGALFPDASLSPLRGGNARCARACRGRRASSSSSLRGVTTCRAECRHRLGSGVLFVPARGHDPTSTAVASSMRLGLHCPYEGSKRDEEPALGRHRTSPQRPCEGSQQDNAAAKDDDRLTSSSSSLRGVATCSAIPAPWRPGPVLIVPTRGHNVPVYGWMSTLYPFISPL